MPDIEIDLEDDEDIVRVYTRIPEQPWLFRKLVATDFARIMHAHSGISLLRLKYLSRQQARNWFDTPKLKGLAICKAKALKDLGLRFMAKSAEDPHVSTRCPPCNLNVDYNKLCQTNDKTDCMLDLEAAVSLSKFLSKSVFVVDTPVDAPER